MRRGRRDFTVASTPRILDRHTNEWKDGDALFLRCSIWRQAAENVAESLQRGTRVIVHGRLSSARMRPRRARSAPSSSCEVDEVGPSLRYATAKVDQGTTQRRRRSGGGSSAAVRLRRRLGCRCRRPVGDSGCRPAAGSPTNHPSSPHLSPFRPSPPRRGARTDWSTTMAKPAFASRRRRSVSSARTRPTTSTTRTPPAAQVHLRPRQDPRPPGHRQLLAAPARHRHGGEEQPRDGAAALHQHRALRGPDDEAHPHPGGRPASASPATSSRSRTATAATTSCRAGSAMLWSKGGEKQVAALRRGREAREIRDLERRPRAGRPARVAARSRCTSRAGDGGRLFGSVTDGRRRRGGQGGRRPDAGPAPARAAERAHQDRRHAPGLGAPAPGGHRVRSTSRSSAGLSAWSPRQRRIRCAAHHQVGRKPLYRVDVRVSTGG